MNELEIVDSYLLTCINLQLAVAQETTKDGKLDVKTIYKNLRKYSVTVGCDLSEFDYSNFLNFLNAHRESFVVFDGEIGVDVNQIALKEKI